MNNRNNMMNSNSSMNNNMMNAMSDRNNSNTAYRRSMNDGYDSDESDGGIGAAFGDAFNGLGGNGGGFGGFGNNNNGFGGGFDQNMGGF